MRIAVKNISEGFKDATGAFHPIRAAKDYKTSRIKEEKGKPKLKPGPKAAARRKAAAAKRKAATQVSGHKRVAAKKSITQLKKMLGVGGKGGPKKNPLPVGKWTKVKMKPLANGDIQIMIS